jgi:hypothetical protein
MRDAMVMVHGPMHGPLCGRLVTLGGKRDGTQIFGGEDDRRTFVEVSERERSTTDGQYLLVTY